MTTVTIASYPLSLIGLAVLAAGCDPHAEPGYQGESLASLSGEVRLERSGTPPSDEVEVFYQNYTDYVSDEVPGDVRFSIPVKVAVTGEYPANFTLDLLEPPPDDALTDFTVNGDPDERRVGLAVIASTYECWENFPADGGRCIFGGAPNRALVWAEDEIQPDTLTAAAVGTTLGAGYHLLEYRDTFATQEELHDCLLEHEGDPFSCPTYTFERELPTDSPLTVVLTDDPEAAFGNHGGAVIPEGSLPLPNWFDTIE